jgi:hypothetical protein
MTPMVNSQYGSCGCGRSPTGKCCGWHGLSEGEYLKKLNEYNQKHSTPREEKGIYLWLDNPDDRNGSI